ncbi:MAG: hypothetical protein JNM04_01710, partial [Chthonomonas sp.]|nr:hypothetical protein [Chthonomonas sp.]
CTTYVLMKELSSAGSTYYRSRAGTTYSVVKRLTTFGFLEVNDEQISISEEGIAALKRWIRPPIPEPDVAYSADLVRLRFYYLGLLSVRERKEFIDDALSELRRHLVKVEWMVHESERIGDYFGMLALANAVLETRARIEWLEMVAPLALEPIADQKAWAKSVFELLNRPR